MCPVSGSAAGTVFLSGKVKSPNQEQTGYEHIVFLCRLAGLQPSAGVPDAPSTTPPPLYPPDTPSNGQKLRAGRKEHYKHNTHTHTKSAETMQVWYHLLIDSVKYNVYNMSIGLQVCGCIVS